MLKQLILTLSSCLLVINLNGAVTTPASGGDVRNYYFILLMPKNDSQYQCAIFPLEKLKICRFPSGPILSNFISHQRACTIDQSCYQNLCKESSQLSVLCVDNNRSNAGHICGFALPWGGGLAYVFDGLHQVDKVTGLIVEKAKLKNLNFKLLDLSELQVSCDQIDGNDCGLDEIDQLIAEDEGDQIERICLPYPFEQIKQVLGRAVIAGLIYYYEIKAKIIDIFRSKNARP